MDNIRPTESLLTFRNSQDVQSRGTIMHLSRGLVVFEVYNPFSIVQLSEVLQDLSIRRGERIVYNGRAVVSNLVNTGLMLIVSAALVDPWSTLNGLVPGKPIVEEVNTFVKEWDTIDLAILPSFRISVGRIGNFLQELSRWLAHGEVDARIADSSTPADEVKAFASDVDRGISTKIDSLFQEFESIANLVPTERHSMHKDFAQRHLHPLILCSPFIHRTFSKPLGYAGDFEMVNMILRDPMEGSNTYAKIINMRILAQDPARGHRNRIEILQKYLEEALTRVRTTGGTIRILNVACGPAAEIQRFFSKNVSAHEVDISLLDFNADTLAYTKDKIDRVLNGQARPPTVTYIHKSIHTLLKESMRRSEEAPITYDMVYCAGLFDYLSDKICERLIRLFYQWTTPGGIVIATNVHKQNPIKNFMDYLLEWHLIYRNEADMVALAPSGTTPVVYADSTGVNVFFELRKSAK